MCVAYFGPENHFLVALKGSTHWRKLMLQINDITGAEIKRRLANFRRTVNDGCRQKRITKTARRSKEGIDTLISFSCPTFYAVFQSGFTRLSDYDGRTPLARVDEEVTVLRRRGVQPTTRPLDPTSRHTTHGRRHFTSDQ